MRRVLIVSGEPGVGKSRAGMDMEEPIEFWDMENKNKELQETYYSNKLINRKDLLVFNNEFREDYYQTLLNLRSEINKLISQGQKVKSGELESLDFQWLIIDGISFIRNKCMKAEWLHNHPGRKNPNEFEWGEINEATRELLFPLINMVVSDIIPNLMFTAEFTDKYDVIEMWDERKQKDVKKSVACGREPAYKDYLGYKAYTLIELYADENKQGRQTGTYRAVCTKSLKGVWEEDITGKSLWDMLIGKGL